MESYFATFYCVACTLMGNRQTFHFPQFFVILIKSFHFLFSQMNFPHLHLLLCGLYADGEQANSSFSSIFSSSSSKAIISVNFFIFVCYCVACTLMGNRQTLHFLQFVHHLLGQPFFRCASISRTYSGKPQPKKNV